MPLQALYNRTLRPLLLAHPRGRKYRMQAGVPVRNAALLDRTEKLPYYKCWFAELVREHVHEGEHVVEIGGGRGVMTTICAERGARVTSYEPSAPMRAVMADTLLASCVRGRVDIRGAAVGPLADADYGSTADARTVPPSRLPDADVLIMDCEGAELDILDGMTIRPDRIIVEAHPDEYDVPGAAPEALCRAAGEDYELGDVSALKPGSHRHAVLLVGDES